jgi:hypothetical protein
VALKGATLYHHFCELCGWAGPSLTCFPLHVTLKTFTSPFFPVTGWVAACSFTLLICFVMSQSPPTTCCF